MPGRLFRTTSAQSLSSEMRVSAEKVRNLADNENISPGEDVIVFEEATLKPMRWGILPVARTNARGKPVMETIINARSETVFQKSAFRGTRRCVLIADGWYEWTGQKRKKTCWKISLKSQEPIFFAAIADTWQGPGGLSVDQVASLTCEPNGDLREIHDRMGVILKRDEIDAWLSVDQRVALSMMQPLANGLLDIKQVTDINQTSP